jgi:type IV secretory pathway component VirB8
MWSKTFEFSNTSNGNRVITNNLENFAAVTYQLAYFTFYQKSLKHTKAVIRYLPINIPAEDISGGLMSLGFGINSVKQCQITVGHRPGERHPKTSTYS